MVRIRAVTHGKHVQPHHIIVAMDSRKRPQGEYLDKLGTYNPITKVAKIEADKVLDYLLKGAQPTPTVRSLLSKEGIMTKFHEIKLANKMKKQSDKPTSTKVASDSVKKAVATPKAVKETKPKASESKTQK